jgi:hypothetical protein
MSMGESLYIKLNFSLRIPKFLSSISRIIHFMSNQHIRVYCTSPGFLYTMYVT